MDEEQVASLPLAAALATLLEGKINTVNYVHSVLVLGGKIGMHFSLFCTDLFHERSEI